MSATINKFAQNFGNTNYYDEGLLAIYQDYRSYFLTNSSTRAMTVDEGTLFQNKHDPVRMLIQKGIPATYVWPIMMINDLHNGKPLPEEPLTLFIPDYDELERVRATYESSKRFT